MEKIYVKGLMVFVPHENAPDFVKGTLVITLEELTSFFNQQAKYHTEYNGKKQLRCQILEGEKGLYFTVDTYKKLADGGIAPVTVPEEKLPF